MPDILFGRLEVTWGRLLVGKTDFWGDLLGDSLGGLLGEFGWTFGWLLGVAWGDSGSTLGDFR